jgi:ATP-binding cassette subfamily C (CFTR/MRP) protein 1
MFTVFTSFLTNKLKIISALLKVLKAKDMTPDVAGASIALALQISVLYQMFIRLCLESHSRMSSAQCILKYGTELPQEDASFDKTNEIKPMENKPAILLKNLNMRYREGLPLVLSGNKFRMYCQFFRYFVKFFTKQSYSSGF